MERRRNRQTETGSQISEIEDITREAAANGLMFPSLFPTLRHFIIAGSHVALIHQKPLLPALSTTRYCAILTICCLLPRRVPAPVQALPKSITGG